jgi:hypothetical protein
MEICPIAWGMWLFRGNDINAAQCRVEAALNTLFDTTDIYGTTMASPSVRLKHWSVACSAIPQWLSNGGKWADPPWSTLAHCLVTNNAQNTSFRYFRSVKTRAPLEPIQSGVLC